eukprot:Sspe_Gene.20795::Locus_7666_Transcript_1_1_Confidence_1.000_Length_2885::g.20795::m.20795
MCVNMVPGLLVLVLLTCCGAAEHVLNANHRGMDHEGIPLKWVLFEIGDNMVRVAHTRDVERGVPSTTPYHSPYPNTGISLVHPTVEDSEDFDYSAAYVQHFNDPRRWHHEHLDPDTGDINGTVVHYDTGYVSARIPAHVNSVHVVQHPSPRRPGPHNVHKVSLHTRHISVLSEEWTFKPVLFTMQKVGPVNDTFNIVFLAGGYSAGKLQKFKDDVQKAMKFLHGITTSEGSLRTSSGEAVSAQPYNRYFRFFNVFAVWDESPQDGANHPDPNGNIKDPRPNRLQCSYGTTIKRMLSCNFAEVLALASHAPKADLILTLVNDPEYGGAGGSGQAALYTGDGFEKVLIHEIGHAAADLSDEYDYGFEEEEDLPLTNCAKIQGNVGWAAWQRKWAQSGLATTPIKVCSYTNYYRPTDKCLMKSSGNPTMCSVCREGVVREGVYREWKQKRDPSVRLDLSMPRCPVAWETLVLRPGAYGVLHVNPTIQDKYMFEHRDGLWGKPFKVTWTCKRAPAGVPCEGRIILTGSSNTTSLTVGACNAVGRAGMGACGWPGADTKEGDYEIEVSVKDTVVESGWMLEDKDYTTSNGTFRIRIDSSTTCTKWDCNARYNRSGEAFFGQSVVGVEGFQVCTKCDYADESRCNITYSVDPIPAETFAKKEGADPNSLPVDTDQIKDKLGNSYYMVLISAALFGLGMLVALYKTCATTFSKDPNAQKYGTFHNVVRFLVVGLFALLVWASIGVVAYGVFLYIQKDVKIWGSVVVIIIIVVGALTFTLSFFVFSAAAARKKWMLLFCAVLLLLVSVGVIILAVIVNQLATHANDTASADNQRNEWESIELDSFGVNINWMEDLRNFWKEACKEDPKTVCGFQNEMKCSGFQKSCFNVENSYCPKGCSDGNRNTNPCMNVIQKKLADNFKIASSVTVALASILSIGMMLTWLLFCVVTFDRPVQRPY